jgi:hypothetical protein
MENYSTTFPSFPHPEGRDKITDFLGITINFIIIGESHAEE